MSAVNVINNIKSLADHNCLQPIDFQGSMRKRTASKISFFLNWRRHVCTRGVIKCSASVTFVPNKLKISGQSDAEVTPRILDIQSVRQSHNGSNQPICKQSSAYTPV